jgi:hypothetical protein
MPQIFSIGSYVVYFWSDEGEPKEPVHVHVAQGRPQIIEVRAMYICSELKKHFEDISFYC